MTAKAYCKKHDRAYPVDEGCIYCTPEKPVQPVQMEFDFDSQTVDTAYDDEYLERMYGYGVTSD